MRAAVGGKKFLLKVSRELSGLVTHLGGKPSSQSWRTSNSAAWLAILRQTLCGRINSSFLNEAETWQALRQRLIPKLTYVLHATSFSTAQCRELNTIINQTFLPRIRLNRHYPRAVLYGPIAYGGMEFPETRSMQCSTQVEYVIKQLRWNKVVANALIVTLDRRAK